MSRLAMERGLVRASNRAEERHENPAGNNTRVALAKTDELMEGQRAFLEDLGIDTSPFEDRGRSYRVETDGIEFFFLSAGDAAGRYYEGHFDAALTGADWMVEEALQRDLELRDISSIPAYADLGGVQKEPYGKVDYVLASPDGNVPSTPRVAAKKPELAEYMIAESFPDADARKTDGSEEVYPLLDSWDAYFGVVESGSTMAQNSMEPEGWYGNSSGVWLGANPEGVLEANTG